MICGGIRRSGLAHGVTRAWRRADPGLVVRAAAGDTPAGTPWEVSRAPLLTSMTLLDPGTATLYGWELDPEFDSPEYREYFTSVCTGVGLNLLIVASSRGWSKSSFYWTLGLYTLRLGTGLKSLSLTVESIECCMYRRRARDSSFSARLV